MSIIFQCPSRKHPPKISVWYSFNGDFLIRLSRVRPCPYALSGFFSPNLRTKCNPCERDVVISSGGLEISFEVLKVVDEIGCTSSKMKRSSEMALANNSMHSGYSTTWSLSHNNSKWNPRARKRKWLPWSRMCFSSFATWLTGEQWEMTLRYFPTTQLSPIFFRCHPFRINSGT